MTDKSEILEISTKILASLMQSKDAAFASPERLANQAYAAAEALMKLAAEKSTDEAGK